jgi:solute carrier family 24 (sodium/potassium/calcium exchanger), member 6
MLNILLGIGIGGLWMIIQSANGKHAKHPDRPLKHKTYKIAIGGTIMVSAISLLITLVGLLIIVPMNKWILTRKIGYGLIALWTVSTIINVVIEMAGVWSELS